MESLVEHLLLYHEKIQFMQQKNEADLISGDSGQFNLV